MPDPRSRALPVFQLDITFLSNDPILDDIRRLGGQVVPATRYHPAATHLILKSQGENKLRIPILASIAGGKWVIKEE